MFCSHHRVLMFVTLAAAGACSPSPDARTAEGTQADSASPAQAIASPRALAAGNVSGVSVSVDYGRPSRRGRSIFGALVPWDRVWRTGANAATTMTLDGPLELGGRPLEAGSYTLYSTPSPSGWTLIVNGQTGQWGTEYDQSRDVLRVPLSLSRPTAEVDTFTISVEDDGGEGRLVLAWDTLQGVTSLRRR